MQISDIAEKRDNILLVYVIRRFYISLWYVFLPNSQISDQLYHNHRHSCNVLIIFVSFRNRALHTGYRQWAVRLISL